MRLPRLRAGILEILFVGLIIVQGRAQVAVPGVPFLDYANKPGSSKFVPACTSTAISSKPTSGKVQHSVTLKWNASRPASAAGKDQVAGYYIYRSATSHSYTPKNRLNLTPLKSTSCIDRAVISKAVYYYSVKAVSRSGVQSAFSQEVKAVIPSP